MAQHKPTYCGGRFTVPPGFDFRLLPQKTKAVVVISIIGNLDSFNQKCSSNLIDAFLKSSAFSLPCVESTIQGYYDCERQIIFLHFRDSEQLLVDLLDNPNDFEPISAKWDEEKLKCLYFLFHVSHFVVITSYGTALNTRYIALFKLLTRLRQLLRHSVDSLLRTLPLPRYCISVGRVACPRLLFVFKLPPTIAARKLAEVETRLGSFEKNLVGQIFNAFNESGLLEGSSGETRLFDLIGYSYVRVLYPDQIDPLCTVTQSSSDKGDLAQTLIETLISASGMSDLLEGSDCRKTMDPPKPHYSPPDRPDDRSFEAFLQCNLTAFLENSASRSHQSEGHSHHNFELPACKAWFIVGKFVELIFLCSVLIVAFTTQKACYKLYSSLMNSPNRSPTPQPPSNAAGAKSARATADADSSLGHHWAQFFHGHCQGVRDAGGGANGEESNAEEASGGMVALSPSLLSTQSQLDRNLSSTRCEIALSESEAHYRKDLPTHYSRTYHLAKVVSAFNVFMRQARGPGVISALDRLTRRLARLYLAGRVGCPEVLLSGATCRQELHRLPDRFPGVAAAYRELLRREGESEEPQASHPLAEYALRLGSSSEVVDMNSRRRKSFQNSVLSDGLVDVPAGLMGQWRCAWIEAALNLITNHAKDELRQQQQEEEEEQRSANTSATKTGSLKHLSLLPHRSDRRYISYCNCGRLQAQRLDPFSYQEANWDFYNSLEVACCNKVTSIPLAPLFLNLIGHHFCPKPAMEGPSCTDVAESAEKRTDKDVEIGDQAGLAEDDTDLQEAEEETFLDAQENFDIFTSENSSGNSIENGGSSVSHEDDDTTGSVDGKCSSPSSSASSMSGSSRQRQPPRGATDRRVVASDRNAPQPGRRCDRLKQRSEKQPITFVDTMPVLGQPPGHLPMFPSWAIHTLGKYFSYSHSSGMSFPGFLRGSNFLLPWDVQLSRPPTASAKSFRGRPRDYDSVKLFLGFEMECPLGHRFFLAGPDRAMTGLMQGCDVRRAVSSLLSCDLPLYQACVCSSSRGKTISDSSNRDRDEEGEGSGGAGGGSKEATSVVWAQLMRIYVALPSAQIRIKFAPRVRPGPVGTPIFHLGPTLDQQLSTENAQQPGCSRNYSCDSRQSEERESPSALTSEPGYVYLDNGLLWVARLPFAYQHNDTKYRRPNMSSQISNCCLLGGGISLEEL